MTSYPDGWRTALLSDAEIPSNQFTLDVLVAWQRSTPTDGWTNNPLGMPAGKDTAPPALATNYAAFPTMGAFRKAMVAFLATKDGQPVYNALTTQGKLSVAWRAIHALQWPARMTETDWPSILLDLVPGGDSDGLPARNTTGRKTTGIIGPTNDALKAVRLHTGAFNEIAQRHLDGTKAVQALMRRMNNNG